MVKQRGCGRLEQIVRGRERVPILGNHGRQMRACRGNVAIRMRRRVC